MIALFGLIVPWLDLGQISNLFFPTETCSVLKIYDGDTMTLNCSGRKVKTRLYCIDAPEIKQRPWGKQARDTLRMIAPRTVSLRKVDMDKYGRIVGEVYVPGATESLNLQMVKQGQAAVYRQYCNSFGYYKAEQQTRDLNQGIWRQAGAHQRPWLSRR